MKHPTRNVIVEYKGRRARTNSNSMWGNLDLKSIARQIEDDSELGASEAQNVDKQSSSSLSVDQVKAEEPVDLELEQSASTESLSAEDEKPVDHVDKPNKPLNLRSQKKPSGNRGVKKIARQQRVDLPLPSSASRPDAAVLQSLHAENIHLKNLMIAKLRSENEKLKTMLAKFDN